MFYDYFKIGWGHIVDWNAIDHILFLLSLAAIYTIGNWKQVLILITSFTIGHSITLILSTFNKIHFSSSWIEFLIPCTIIMTAVTNLFQKENDIRNFKINYFLALFFGLIHGLGFANGLKSLLGKDQDIVLPLLGFNVGIEAGQVFIVALILLLSWLLIEKIKMSRRDWMVLVSGASLSMALKFAIERKPF